MSPVPSGKPDFLDILIRRRRSVPDYLETMAIKNKSDLNNLISSLLNDYNISQSFISLSENHLKTIVETDSDSLKNESATDSIIEEAGEIPSVTKKLKTAKKSFKPTSKAQDTSSTETEDKKE